MCVSTHTKMKTHILKYICAYTHIYLSVCIYLSIYMESYKTISLCIHIHLTLIYTWCTPTHVDKNNMYKYDAYVHVCVYVMHNHMYVFIMFNVQMYVLCIWYYMMCMLCVFLYMWRTCYVYAHVCICYVCSVYGMHIPQYAYVICVIYMRM